MRGVQARRKASSSSAITEAQEASCSVSHRRISSARIGSALSFVEKAAGWQGRTMESEPCPVEVRHAVVGAIMMALGAYVGGGALWTWLFWADQHIDASRLFALLFAFVSITGGWTLIERWLAGEWFEGRKHRWNSDTTDMQDHSGSHPGTADGSGSNCDLGSSDSGSCSN